MSQKDVNLQVAKASKRSVKNFLINPRYQLRYVFWLGSTGLTLIGIYSVLFYLYMRENYSILVDLSPMTEAAKAQLYRELFEVIIQISLFSLFFLILVLAVGIVYSHRTAGPMFQFKRVFEKIKSGEIHARIHLRPKDEFQEVAAAFNEMMDSVAKK